jgi:6-phosphogluconolactonase
MLKSAQSIIDVEPDTKTVALKVANWILELANKATDRFAICLAGGSTPRILYGTLSASPFLETIPWSRIHWFWGDERFVAQDSELSNFNMVNEAMLSKCPVPDRNIHRIKTELGNPEECARIYEQELQTYYQSDRFDPSRTLFDITLLGLGTDGHTASLFPNSPVLTERKKWVCAVIGAKPEPRITLTYPALDSSKALAFLVTGADKKDIFHKVRNGNNNYPAGLIKPTGNLYWFLDQAAYPTN